MDAFTIKLAVQAGLFLALAAMTAAAPRHEGTGPVAWDTAWMPIDAEYVVIP